MQNSFLGINTGMCSGLRVGSLEGGERVGTGVKERGLAIITPRKLSLFFPPSPPPHPRELDSSCIFKFSYKVCASHTKHVGAIDPVKFIIRAVPSDKTDFISDFNKTDLGI